MHRLISLALTVACAACATDSSSGDTLSPLGNWSMTFSWGSGTCGITQPTATTLTLTDDPSGGYIINESDPSVTATGTVTCTKTDCKLSGSEAGTLNGDPSTVGYNLTLKSDATISGSGSISVSGATACSQTFTALGRLQ
jgi:hypothetical protein